MKGGRNILTVMGMNLVLIFTLMNCAGGHVSQNGIFENDHRELKEALVGSWQIINPGVEVAGREMYEFYREERKVKLKVLGEEVAVERFDSPDGLSFTFEYKLADDKPIYVVGQFKSYQRKELVCMQELPSVLPESLSVIRLEKRPKAQATVVAGVKHE